MRYCLLKGKISRIGQVAICLLFVFSSFLFSSCDTAPPSNDESREFVPYSKTYSMSETPKTIDSINIDLFYRLLVNEPSGYSNQYIQINNSGIGKAVKCKYTYYTLQENQDGDITIDYEHRFRTYTPPSSGQQELLYAQTNFLVPNVEFVHIPKVSELDYNNGGVEVERPEYYSHIEVKDMQLSQYWDKNRYSTKRNYLCELSIIQPVDGGIIFSIYEFTLAYDNIFIYTNYPESEETVEYFLCGADGEGNERWCLDRHLHDLFVSSGGQCPNE